MIELSDLAKSLLLASTTISDCLIAEELPTQEETHVSSPELLSRIKHKAYFKAYHSQNIDRSDIKIPASVKTLGKMFGGRFSSFVEKDPNGYVRANSNGDIYLRPWSQKCRKYYFSIGHDLSELNLRRHGNISDFVQILEEVYVRRIDTLKELANQLGLRANGLISNDNRAKLNYYINAFRRLGYLTGPRVNKGHNTTELKLEPAGDYEKMENLFTEVLYPLIKYTTLVQKDPQSYPESIGSLKQKRLNLDYRRIVIISTDEAMIKEVKSHLSTPCSDRRFTGDYIFPNRSMNHPDPNITVIDYRNGAATNIPLGNLENSQILGIFHNEIEADLASKQCNMHTVGINPLGNGGGVVPKGLLNAIDYMARFPNRKSRMHFF
jgi:hypothetical protein